MRRRRAPRGAVARSLFEQFRAACIVKLGLDMTEDEHERLVQMIRRGDMGFVKKFSKTKLCYWHVYHGVPCWFVLDRTSGRLVNAIRRNTDAMQRMPRRGSGQASDTPR